MFIAFWGFFIFILGGNWGLHRLGGLVGWSIMDAVKYKCGWKPLDSFATLGVGFPFCTFPVCFFSMFFFYYYCFIFGCDSWFSFKHCLVICFLSLGLAGGKNWV